MKKVASTILPMIAIDKGIATPLHRQIYEAYRVAIVDGRLRPGQRIPSTRELAPQLGVSRLPVLNAYAQLLSEGYFESRAGAGTIISRSLPERFTSSQSSDKPSTAPRHGPRPIARNASLLPPSETPPWLRGNSAFGAGQVAFAEFPLEIWSRLVAHRSRNIDARSLAYGERIGAKALREAITVYLRTARAVRCEPEQVMIVSGSQQGLDISGRVLLDPGSSVWIEEPGYRFAHEAFALSGCRFVPVPVDGNGMDVSIGIKRCRSARAAFITPSHQLPLGVTMSATRRLQLLNWAANEGSWIIEDDYDSEFRYAGSPIASLQGLDANDRVIYIGTFSKVLFPSLRLGYVVIPPDLVDRFVAVRHAIDLVPPSFHQEVLAEFISEGHFARHIRRMRVLYSERRKALVQSIRQELGSMVEVLGDEAGLFLTMTLPPGSPDLEIAVKAGRQDLLVWPLSACYFSDAACSGLVLGFGNTPVEEIPNAVRRLSKLLVAR